MKAKYIKIDNPERVKYKINWQISYDRFPLIIGKEYIVYAIEYTNKKKINFFLLGESGIIFPYNYPSEFFEITDNRLSKYWEGYDKNDSFYPLKNPIYPNLISFKEWRDDEYFEWKMFENTDDANEIFQKYKNLIDNEYPNDQLENAVSVGDNWVMCFNCDNSWEISNNNGVIECPKCNTRQNNPYY